MSTSPAHRLTQRLERLVSAKTLTSSPEVSQAFLDAMAIELENVGMRVVVSTQGGFPYLYAHFQPLSETTVWMAAHLDVVNALPKQFQLERRSGKLYGRGVFDMKFAIAIYGELIENLADTKPPIGIIITSDEESSGRFGSGYLASRLKLKDKTVILPDGGGTWAIEQAAKGVLWAHLQAEGKAAHAAYPQTGSNAIESLMETIAEIKRVLEAGSGHNFNDTTINIGRISGGGAINQVAAEAAADLDIRFAAPTSATDLQRHLNAIAKKTGVTIKSSVNAPARIHDLDHPHTQLLHEIMEERVGHELPFVSSYGASDAQYFTAAGAHTIVFYPEGGAQHTDHEYITEASLLQCYDILHTFIARVGANEHSRTAQARD